MPSDPDHLLTTATCHKRILVAPLNWGLGHATRCIPLIQTLESLGAEVILASDGIALHLLKAEFPHLKTVRLPGYRIRYFTKNMTLNILRQLPRILFAIKSEQWETERIVREHRIQGVISDNRYGCFSRHIPNIILTHQLNLKVPNPFFAWAANRLLRRALAKFQEVWAPDTQHPPTLSATLSHPAPGVKNLQYIGLLSRAAPNPDVVEKDYDVAVVLSGPEPQRSHLEQLLLEQAMLLPRKFIFIQGKTKTKTHHFVADHIEQVSYLTTPELNAVVTASDIVICRSGYSSLMDLAANGKRAVLIPTPGQTEQEYLAECLAQQNHFVVQNQDSIDLEAALRAVEGTTGLSHLKNAVNIYHATLESWVKSL